MVSILIGIAIFGYAAWTLIRYYQKSKQGKCAACTLNKTCTTSCDDVSTQNRARFKQKSIYH
ncbi:FeoB-associated Cys-rich membrane protein [Hazenella coriacea]|uniref:Radical SAM protein with 4Fe4S-binding SPASM domain n=1 Tax=Hazenella coriacea TaxID=1179467 RepID=A0A4R3L7Z6_9BACL|nr:FeoB-associated Cys-rich membrane protein [Hazenella coriacea]TCS95759.1 radical SAM protein with 4Fe4S-binding SPASM domain [Hazenella coriacea]